MDWTRVASRTSMALAFLGAYWIALTIPNAGLLTQPGSDAFNYWNARLPNPYVGLEGTNTFLYSPVAAMAIWPLTLMPWPAFHLLWIGLNAAALVWMARGWSLPLLFLPPVTLELWLGQVHLLLAAAIVLSFRYPAAWAAVLLTKVTPGVGLLWYPVRREWRSLGIALAATGVLAGVSYVIAPGLWTDWINTLTASVGVPITALTVTTAPLLPRLAIAAALVVLGAWRGWRWLVPIAAFLALPTVWTFGASMLVACIPLVARARRPEMDREAVVATPPPATETPHFAE